MRREPWPQDAVPALALLVLCAALFAALTAPESGPPWFVFLVGAAYGAAFWSVLTDWRRE